ncbi:MAG: malectin [Actinomycetota bacterium]|nr:malectin [Actinomycetota bacterium]
MSPSTFPSLRWRYKRNLPATLGLSLLTAVTAVTVPASPAAQAATAPVPSLAASTTELVPVLRMNVGGGKVTAGGVTWQADRGVSGGRTWTNASTADIASTLADPIYRSERNGWFTYNLPVPAAGDYVVRLHFAEIYWGAPQGAAGGPGKRIFSVNLEGGAVELANYDIAASVGSMRAVVKQFRTRVTDGQLTLTTNATADRAKLSALEILRPATTAVSPTPTPTPTATPTATPTPTATATSSTAFGLGWGRPFAPDSAYNRPIPAGAVTDPNSAAMVAVIARNNRAYANLYDYGDPVFDADSASPQYSVACTMPWGTCDLETKRIRIPSGAKPTPGTDGRMIIVDWTLREVCDFWQARRTSTGGWETSWGTCASIDGEGSGLSGGATGAGINALAGVVRTYDMRQGRIDHALSFATDNSCQRVFRYPAKKTDGSSARSDCIPEGARIQLDPSINVDAIPGITPGEKAVAKALQVYGAYNRDNAGAPMAFSFENPIGESDPYPAAGFGWDYYDMPHIPWSKIRVLRSWNGE